MSISMFDTRTMIAALEQMKPVRTFFLNMFFNSVEISNTKYVDIDIMKGKRRLAPFVNPRLQGKVIDHTGYSTKSYSPPYIKPKMITTAADILQREMGNTIYAANASPAQRAAAQLGKDLAEMDALITRREEWMAAVALQTGQVPIVGDGVNEVIDFAMLGTHKPTLTGGDLWSAPTTATPLDDLRAWKRLIGQDSGLVPTDVVFGFDVLDAFLKCDQVIGEKGLFNQMQINMGKIDPNALPDGVTYYGRLTELGLDIWTIDDWYLDPTDNATEYPMMAAKKILMGSRRARCVKHYGAIQDLSATAAVARFPKSWEEEDPSARFVMVQSAPLPAPHQIDAFLCATVVS